MYFKFLNIKSTYTEYTLVECTHTFYVYYKAAVPNLFCAMDSVGE